MIQEEMRAGRHGELAKFLVSRRIRLRPEFHGLRAPRRRRQTPGLRRDEVSALAGISTTYYTWIEQGRRFDVSSAVLEAIAGALQLNDIESAHLFTLAGKATPQRMLAAESPGEDNYNALLQFAKAFSHGPAMVLTPSLDVVEVNRSGSEALGVASGANLAEAVLCGSASERVANRDALAAAFVALLRRNHALDVDNDRTNSVIANLRSGNAAFKLRWDSHVIDRTPLLDFQIDRVGSGREYFDGIVMSDPISMRQFALFMCRSAEATPQHRRTMPRDRNVRHLEICTT
jgi:transcriptional regulator with XRE-family HTH domain